MLLTARVLVSAAAAAAAAAVSGSAGFRARVERRDRPAGPKKDAGCVTLSLLLSAVRVRRFTHCRILLENPPKIVMPKTIKISRGLSFNKFARSVGVVTRLAPCVQPRISSRVVGLERQHEEIWDEVEAAAEDKIELLAVRAADCVRSCTAVQGTVPMHAAELCAKDLAAASRPPPGSKDFFFFFFPALSTRRVSHFGADLPLVRGTVQPSTQDADIRLGERESEKEKERERESSCRTAQTKKS
ncbi:hypothetical protein L1887_48927 [Cichorium endivia]|nr:hypothetical protein L1887_48927 [Cichorium endivia]